MSGELPADLREVLEPLVRRVVAGDFKGLSRDGLTAHPEADLGLWARAYPGDLAEVPDEGWELATGGPFRDLPGFGG